MRKRLLSILLTACMVLTLLPTVALAATGTSTYGAFTVTYDGTAPSYASSTLTLGSGTYTISGTTTADKIVVTSGATANVTLSNVNIDVSGTYDACAFDMSGATVNLTLSGTNTLKSGSRAAGLRVPSGASLTITAASTGSLSAWSIYAGAGIGGRANEGCGTVTINGGTVTATGGVDTSFGNSGAGIGGGTGGGGTGGTVVITGGVVTAKGDSNSAGIGGGGTGGDAGGAGGTVKISGGTVIATGGDWRGAGIGGGGGTDSGNGAAVTITGGSVKAIGGGTYGAAIGAGAAGSAAGTNHGTLKNGSGTDVTLYTLTLPGINSTAVTALTFTPALGYTYGTTDMKTDADGKLYVYLPAGKTSAYITTAAGTYVGNISGNAVTTTLAHAVSGMVNAGTTGTSVSGLTVNLYESTDTNFANSVGSATTDGSGAYTIYVPNGSYVARVAGVADSYIASVSDAIPVSGSAVSGANITLSRASYTGSAAGTPSLISKTDTQVALAAVTVAGQSVEYGKNTSNATPTAWQDDTNFNGLTANTTYYFFARVKQAGAVEAGGVSSALTVITKAAEATTPDVPTIGTGTDKPTSSSITVDTVARYEYYISNSATADWSGTPNGYFKEIFDGSHKFDSLTPGTQYYIHVRVAETDSAMPSASNSVSQYTLPATPSAGVGYSVDYATEIITVNSGYEVNTSSGFGASTAVLSNDKLAPGTSYYVRVATTGGVPASDARSFEIPERPSTPSGITAANITKTKAAITISNTAAGQECFVNGTWYTPVSGKVEVTGLGAGIDYSIVTRVKATANSFASLSSEAFTVKTKTDGSTGFALPTISVTPTYAHGKTLNDIPLTTGWAWSAPTTVPTVAINSYKAVYTPSDTATVDYFGIEGYAVDGSGKVTITRDISLTVNRATPTASDFTFTAPASLNFSGTAKTAAVTAKSDISGMGAVTVKYYDEDGAVVDAPTNAGTYTVKINVVQGDNYAAASDVTDNAWTFTIEKAAQATLTITNKPDGVVTYGDTFTLETAGGSGTGAVTWKSSNVNSATVDANGAVIIKGVGVTTITATKAADANYADAVTATYTFSPAKRLITVGAPSATGGWTKTYDGKTDFDKSVVTVGGITNKVGLDDVNVTLQSATYDTADVGSGNKTLTITYAIDGTKSDNYLAPNNTVVSTASITAATPTITLKSKTKAFTGKKIEIDAASVNGITSGTTADGAITYIYYTKDTCTDADKTTVDKSAADTIGGAPKNAGTYYVKANIAASGNYLAATSAAVTLTIYYPSSGDDKSSAPVIVDGKTVDMGTSEVKDGTTTVKVDQNKMSEQLKNAKDSVEIPIASKTDTASAQLVVQNVENMAERSMTLTVKANDISYEIPTISVDTAAILKNLGASDSSKVPLNVTISKLSNNAVTIKDGKLMVAPVAFTVTATYNGKSIEVDRFESYVQRVIEIPSGVDPRIITTAVVAQANGTQRHVPTKVYSEGGKWYAKINSMTNSTYALIQNSVSFTDTTGKWYANAVTELASRKVISGIGENMFAGERAIIRAEFAAILVRALGLPDDGTSAFSDVSASAWYSGAVATAAQYGLVTGKGGNSFDPNANITRQEAMTMLQRAAKLTGYSGTAGSLEGFTDEGSINSWAVDAAKWSVGSGLIQGSDGKLNPTANISRAESATVILRLLQKTGLVDVRSEA